MFVRRRLLKEKDQIIKWYQEKEQEYQKELEEKEREYQKELEEKKREYQKELEEKQRLIEALREKAEECERLLREKEENLKQGQTENTLRETDQFHDDGTAVLRPQTASVSWELYPMNSRRKSGAAVFNPFKQW